MGIESWNAPKTPVIVLEEPGPFVTKTHAGLFVIRA